MTILEIARQRLHNQRIAQGKFHQPNEVVAWMGAMQAQDYASVRWAVGLRCEKVTDVEIEKAIAEKKILDLAAAGTLQLVSPGISTGCWVAGAAFIAGSTRRNRQLELDEATFSSSYQILTKALQGGGVATRGEMMHTLEKADISTAGQRGYHILGRAALEGLICFGPPQGKQQTFVLLDEWAPKAAPGDTMALAELPAAISPAMGQLLWRILPGGLAWRRQMHGRRMSWSRLNWDK
jgi:hypothetical protein